MSNMYNYGNINKILMDRAIALYRLGYVVKNDDIKEKLSVADKFKIVYTKWLQLVGTQYNATKIEPGGLFNLNPILTNSRISNIMRRTNKAVSNIKQGIDKSGLKYPFKLIYNKMKLETHTSKGSGKKYKGREEYLMKQLTTYIYEEANNDYEEATIIAIAMCMAYAFNMEK